MLHCRLQVVMLAAAGACAYQGGVAGLLFGHCPAMSDVGTLSLFRPWAALDALKVLGAWQQIMAIAGYKMISKVCVCMQRKTKGKFSLQEPCHQPWAASCPRLPGLPCVPMP